MNNQEIEMEIKYKLSIVMESIRTNPNRNSRSGKYKIWNDNVGMGLIIIEQQ